MDDDSLSRTHPQELKQEGDCDKMFENQNEMINNVKCQCLNGIESWKERYNESDLKVSPISGGCSNYIFRVSIKTTREKDVGEVPEETQFGPTEVLVRLFGTGLLDLGINREIELVCIFCVFFLIF